MSTIISGELKFFDLNINCSDFKSVYFHKKNKEYQNAIDIEGVIPLENKQEENLQVVKVLR